ncbi:PspA/IM30 family protein [Pseudalkalibacillus salsuginis]|uniref:PspA/IM30 family protein n=1 Tax=Pseudalkalibacillus salsuginis TaxID=2910972 RepID=UPI001F1C89B5|nr:PspA/IM30 family protein [Pseudalkalibacillus salsuginis]MCF6410358.1 PspA/IM30 family protein [Pseudalkalibacillus salsuginis]
MFELFKRVKTIVNSELNSLIDKAEDPIKMVEQYLREMASDIQEAEKATAKIMAEEKLLKMKWEEAQSMVGKREEQAIHALQENNEDLAKRALEDKGRLQQEASQLEHLYIDASKTAADLKEKLAQMKSEYRDMEMKKATLKSRAQSAKARTNINRSMSMHNSEGTKKGFKRMEEKVLRFEAEAETSEDLNVSSRTLDDELKEMEQKSSIDEELRLLKERMANQTNVTNE